MNQTLYFKKLSMCTRWTKKLVVTCLLSISGLFTVQAQTIWNAGSLTFTETVSGQMDNITTQTHLTRVTVLYNAVCQTVSGSQGCLYTGPCNTTWAVGTIANWNTLTYQNFYVANGCFPTNGLPKTYVCHLLAENIYLQITFTSWASGAPGMSYTRTTGPACPLNVFPTATPSTICAGSSTNLSVTSTGSVGPVTYTWTPGGLTGSTVSVSPATSTVYTVSGTDGSCTATATVAVTVNSAPNLTSVTASPASVCFNSNSTLTANITGPSLTYCASTHASGCSGDQITLVVLNTLNNPTSGCGGVSHQTFFNGGGAQTTTLSNSGSPYNLTLSFGPDGTQYFGAWIDYNEDGIFSTGEFLGASANAGSSGTIAVSFTVPPGTVNGVKRMRVIGGNDSPLTSAQACGASSSSFGETQDYLVTITGGIAPYTFAWSPSTFLVSTTTNPASAVGITANTTYTVLVTNVNGCTATGTVSVTTNPLVCGTPTVSSPVCSGTNFTVTANPSGGGQPYATYTWSNGASTASFIDTKTAGSYTYTVTVMDACGNTCSSSVTVVVNATPTASIIPNGAVTVCTNNLPLILTASTSGVSPTYLWKNNGVAIAPPQTNSTLSVTTAGSYTVVVTDGVCSAESSPTVVTVNTSAAPPSVSPTTIAVCQNAISSPSFTGNCTATGTQTSTSSGATGLPITWTSTQAATSATLPVSAFPAGSTTTNVSVTVNINHTWGGDIVMTLQAPNGGPTLNVLNDPNDNNIDFGSASGAGPSLPYTFNATGVALPTSGAVASPGPYLPASSFAGYNGFNPNGTWTLTVSDGVSGDGGTVELLNITITANTLVSGPADWYSVPTGGTLITSTSSFNPITDGGVNTAIPGNYNFYAECVGGNGCPSTRTPVTFVVNAAPVLNCGGTNVSCFGGSNGAASVSATGNGPFTYLWSNGNTNGTISGLTAGIYCVTVTDANGCTASCCYNVTQPTALSASAAATNASCPLCPDGTVSIISTSGGTTPYSFTNLSGLLPGNYCITVTDANGCTTSACATVGAAGCTLTANMTLNNNVSCFGLSNGSATVTPSGSITNGPYSYSWDNGNTNATANNLNAGNHTVILTDNGTGCVTQGNITITQPALLTANCGGTNVSCFGGSNGSASVSAGGGTPPYSYLWSTSAVTSSIGGLGAGSYCVTVTDAHGCTATCCYTVTSPSAPLNATGTVTNVLCAESPTGAINTTVTGGTGTKTFLWSTGATTQNLTGVPKGTYTLTVTDANGCTTSYTNSVACTDNIAPSFGTNTPGNITVHITSVSFADEVTWNLRNAANVIILSGGPYGGGINVTAGPVPSVGGPFTLNMFAGTNFNDNDATFQVICNGNILATSCVRGAFSGQTCGNINTGVITGIVGCSTNNSTCPANIIVNNTPGLCGANVSYTVPTATDNCLFTTVSNHNPGDLFPYGPSTVLYTATDGCGNVGTCSFTVTVNDNEAPVFNCPTNKVTDCNGVGTYAITATDNCGTANLTLITGLASGSTFPVGVTTVTYSANDGHGNTSQCTFTVTRYPTLTALCGGTNVSCNGGNNGNASVTPGGGNPPYSYLWDGGQVTQTAVGLVVGIYCVTVTDANGCTATCCYTVTEPAPLIVPETHTNVSCFGGNNGSITANPSGGTPAYSYSWSNGATTQTTTGLTAGTYTCIVTDSHGCTNFVIVTVSQPPQLFITETHVNVSCKFGSNGSIDITLAGGTPPFSYIWSNGSTTEDIGSLNALAYFVTVTQGNGCTQVFGINVTEPTAISVVPAVTNPTSGNPTGGAINLTVTGGTPGFTYLWNNGSTSQNRSSLSAGTYTVVVTDANGCTKTVIIVLTLQCNLSAVNTVIQNASCFKNNGIVTVTPSGGTSYTYAWQTSPVQTTATGTGLAYGLNSYCIITDASGCTKIDTVVVPLTTSIGCTLTSPNLGGGKNISCNGGSNGSINTSITGDPGPFTYLWSNGATTANLTGLPAGAYTLTVTTGSGGCTNTSFITLTQPSAINATTSGVNPSCGGNNGSATVAVSGGTGPYSYSWNTVPIRTTATITGLAAGAYTVTVTDANGCTKSKSVTLINAAGLTVTGVVTNAKCNGTATGSIDITPAGGTAPYTYLWSTGHTTQDRLNVLAAGTYTVTVTDSKGCTGQFSATITQPAVITATSTSTNVSCFGGNNGTASVTPSGGTPGYTYSWNTVPTKTTAAVTGLKKGTYTCLITDSKGCVKSVTIVITEPSALSIAISKTNVTVFGGNNGTATANVVGGTPPYSYSWSTAPVQTNQTATGLIAGTYTVTVTDSKGCTKSATVTITQPSSRALGNSHTGNDNYSVIYPNPSSGFITLTFNQVIQSKVSIEIYNLTGERVYTKEVKVESNSNSFNLDLSPLAKGVYTVKYQTGDKDWIDKLVIQ
ncbi:MAG: T9SS type A sorting domain-containing protein [Bacteroidia bacterium]